MRLLAPTLFLFLIACGGTDAPATTAPTPTASPTPLAELTVDPEVMKKADLADGTEDHVVSQCGSCALGMEGSADHAVTVGDYEMHFCSASCELRMKETPEAVMETVEKAVKGS